mgnify:FL=1
MSFMDIPLRCPNGVPIENDGNMGINITAPNNLIIYRNYFCSCDMNINNTVIVLRKIFFVNAIGSTRNYLLSEDKLLVDVIYGCDIIVANLNSIEADLDVPLIFFYTPILRFQSIDPFPSASRQCSYQQPADNQTPEREDRRLSNKNFHHDLLLLP